MWLCCQKEGRRSRGSKYSFSKQHQDRSRNKGMKRREKKRVLSSRGERGGSAKEGNFINHLCARKSHEDSLKDKEEEKKRYAPQQHEKKESPFSFRPREAREEGA